MLAEVLQTDQTDVALHCHPQFRPLCLSPVCVVSLCVCRRFDHSRSVPPTHHSAFILLPSIILVPLRLHSSVALTALIPLFSFHEQLLWPYFCFISLPLSSHFSLSIFTFPPSQCCVIRPYYFTIFVVQFTKLSIFSSYIRVFSHLSLTQNGSEENPEGGCHQTGT